MSTPSIFIANWKQAAEVFRGSTTAMDTRLLAIFQNAYGSIWDMDDWKFKKKEDHIHTVAGTESYALPSDFRWPQQWATPLKFEEGGEVFYADEKEYYQRDRSASNGKPVRYSIIWDATTVAWKIYLHPTPDAAYILNIPYVAKAATLLTSTTLTMPESHIRAVESLFYLKAYREYNRAGRYNTEIKQAKEDAREAMARLHADDRAGMLDSPMDVYGDVECLNFLSEENF
jgi:hypothetical protein